MTTTRARTSVLCSLRLHHDVVVNDANPENRRSVHLECTRCGRFRDTTEYEPTSSGWMTNGVSFF